MSFDASRVIERAFTRDTKVTNVVFAAGPQNTFIMAVYHGTKIVRTHKKMSVEECIKEEQEETARKTG